MSMFLLLIAQRGLVGKQQHFGETYCLQKNKADNITINLKIGCNCGLDLTDSGYCLGARSYKHGNRTSSPT
jgi:ferredoxin-thioredoxin reductase catalytic subunit